MPILANKNEAELIKMTCNNDFELEFECTIRQCKLNVNGIVK